MVGYFYRRCNIPQKKNIDILIVASGSVSLGKIYLNIEKKSFEFMKSKRAQLADKQFL